MSKCRHFMIYSPNEAATNSGRGFWLNRNGWVEIQDATLFTEDEKEKASLPMSLGDDRRWVPLDLDYSCSEHNNLLLAAYMGIGFSQTYASLSSDEKEEDSKGIGYPKLVCYVVNQAGFLNDVFNRSRDCFSSISFYKDIAEKFGKEYTAAILRSDIIIEDEPFLQNLAVDTLKDVCEKALPKDVFKMLLSPK